MAYADLSIAGSGSGNGDNNQAALYLQGPAGISRKYSSLVLKAIVSISADSLSLSNAGFKHATFQYSLDGGLSRFTGHFTYC